MSTLSSKAFETAWPWSTPKAPFDVSLPVHRRGAATRSVKDIVFTDAVSPGMLLKVLQHQLRTRPFFRPLFPGHRSLGRRPPASRAALGWRLHLASTAWGCEMMGMSHPSVSTQFEQGEAWDDWRDKARLEKRGTSERYPQVFEDRLGFVEGRSILDVLFHLGPEAATLPSRHGNHDPA